MLAIVEGADKLDNNATAFDCSDDEFRSIEASLHQVLHRTTANEPLRIVQQTRGQRGCEAWHATMRRYDQRNMTDKNSACAALISNISEKDRAKDVEQFDDILRTFTNEMNKFENRFGKIRDEEKVLAVKKLMPDSLLNCSFRGTTMPYFELTFALENIIVDKVSTVPSSKSRRNDTSAPMEIGMAAKEDGESVRQEGEQRIMDLALQAFYKEPAKESALAKVRTGTRRVTKVERMEERIRGRRAAARKEAKGKRKGGKGESRTCWTCGKTGHIAAWCRIGGNTKFYAVDEDDGENAEESTENEEDLQAWCLLEKR